MMGIDCSGSVRRADLRDRELVDARVLVRDFEQGVAHGARALPLHLGINGDGALDGLPVDVVQRRLVREHELAHLRHAEAVLLAHRRGEQQSLSGRHESLPLVRVRRGWLRRGRG